MLSLTLFPSGYINVEYVRLYVVHFNIYRRAVCALCLHRSKKFPCIIYVCVPYRVNDITFPSKPMTWFSAFNIHRSFVCMWAVSVSVPLQFSMAKPGTIQYESLFFPTFNRKIRPKGENIYLEHVHYRAKCFCMFDCSEDVPFLFTIY